MPIAKFKVDKVSKGAGTLTLEKSTIDSKTIILLIFRNTTGTLLFQGQLVKNISKLLKYTRLKPYKVQRIVTAIEKKEAGNHTITRCLITVLFN
jgi:hypothetical protein